MSATDVKIVPEASAEALTGKGSSRLMSLDVFRGATIAAMILVNNPGDGRATYWPLEHAKWNGWTPTDLIFPFFLFIVGVAMTYSFGARLDRGAPRTELVRHVLWRGLILCAIGLFLNGFPNHYQLSSWRVYGVLQRIGICYVIAGLLALWARPRTWMVATFVCLVGYWAIMRFLPVPGYGMPGRDIPFLDPDMNLAAWLDRKLLAGHLYDVTRDPEGVISTLPAIATPLLGLLTGEWLRSPRAPNVKLAGLLGFGFAGVAAGELVNVWFPINKNLWTSSFVLLTAGIALIGLGLCYGMLDMKRWRGSWTKSLLVFGMNPIAAYVFAELISHWIDRMPARAGMNWQEAVYENIFAPLAAPYPASLMYAISYVAACWLAMWLLYRKKIFLKI